MGQLSPLFYLGLVGCHPQPHMIYSWHMHTVLAKATDPAQCQCYSDTYFPEYCVPSAHITRDLCFSAHMLIYKSW